jgi:hypothetical protein
MKAGPFVALGQQLVSWLLAGSVAALSGFFLFAWSIGQESWTRWNTFSDSYVSPWTALIFLLLAIGFTLQNLLGSHKSLLIAGRLVLMIPLELSFLFAFQYITRMFFTELNLFLLGEQVLAHYASLGEALVPQLGMPSPISVALMSNIAGLLLLSRARMLRPIWPLIGLGVNVSMVLALMVLFVLRALGVTQLEQVTPARAGISFFTMLLAMLMLAAFLLSGKQMGSLAHSLSRWSFIRNVLIVMGTFLALPLGAALLAVALEPLALSPGVAQWLSFWVMCFMLLGVAWTWASREARRQGSESNDEDSITKN